MFFFPLSPRCVAGADSCRRASAVALRCGQAGAGSPAPASLPARRWVSAGPSALAASGRGVARSLTARVRLSPGGSSPPPHPLSRGSLTGASIRSPPPPGTHTPPSNCLAPMKKGGPGVGVVPVLVWGGFSPGFRWKLGEGRAGYRAPRGAVVGPGSAGSPPHRCRSRLRLPHGQARGVRRPLAAGA